jgi:cobalt-zinc-cadmium resistance protein CzcA
VLSFVESLGPRVIGEVHEGQRRFELALRLEGEATQGSVARLGGLVMRTERGALLPLSSVATLRIVEGPATINREWSRRRVLVQANVRGRDVGSFVEELRGALGAQERAPGYYWELGGQFEHYERARDRLRLVVPASLLLVLGLLYMTYGRVLDVLRVFTGVPFGMVGGVMALWLRGMPLSISAGVGFVALSGVAVLGDMVLVSRIKQLLARGLGQEEAIREAARTRLRPVLMTSLVAALGFVPMALNTGVGAEVQRPLATVVIGGMFTSCLATLLVLPLLYSLFGAQADEEAPR